jgi:carbonic anhydrase
MTRPTSSSKSPEEVLQLLREGNARFVEGRCRHPHADLAARREVALHGQHPFATVLGCSDSRVPPEILFDQGVGDLFVVRTAGQVLGEAVLASIEYAVLHLETPLVVVLGHSRCGAVTATVQGGDAHGHLPRLIARIAPAVAEARAEAPGAGPEALVEAATRRHVELVRRAILDECPEVRVAQTAGRCRIQAAFYDLQAGLVEFPDGR